MRVSKKSFFSMNSFPPSTEFLIEISVEEIKRVETEKIDIGNEMKQCYLQRLCSELTKA